MDGESPVAHVERLVFMRRDVVGGFGGHAILDVFAGRPFVWVDVVAFFYGVVRGAAEVPFAEVGGGIADLAARVK